MATVMITGGTGLVGTQLSKMLLAKGYQVIILTRDASDVKDRLPGAEYANWDVHAQAIDAKAVSKTDHIIHLAGANVAEKRWTEKRKQEIVNSRTKTSALIVKALTEIPNQVQTVVSASAIGWYGPDTSESKKHGFAEDAGADNAFLGETCRLWEESIEPVTVLGKRLVKLRTGIVLSREGGALAEFKTPVKWFVAPILGNGKQVISWIHVDDLCRMYIDAIENPELHGAYNAVAPQPVTNKVLTLTLAGKMRGSWFLPIYVPSFFLKILLGEMSIEVLKSATVRSSKIEASGFVFQYSTIDSALSDLIN